MYNYNHIYFTLLNSHIVFRPRWCSTSGVATMCNFTYYLNLYKHKKTNYIAMETLKFYKIGINIKLICHLQDITWQLLWKRKYEWTGYGNGNASTFKAWVNQSIVLVCCLCTQESKGFATLKSCMHTKITMFCNEWFEQWEELFRIHTL